MTSAEIGAAVLPWAQAVAMAFVPTAGTIAGLWLRKRGISQDVIEAASRGAGLGYSAIVKSGLPHNSAEAVALGEQVATNYLTTMVPGKIATVALDPAGVANLAAAQLGKVLGVAGAGNDAVVNVEGTPVQPIIPTGPRTQIYPSATPAPTVATGTISGP